MGNWTVLSVHESGKVWSCTQPKENQTKQSTHQTLWDRNPAVRNSVLSRNSLCLTQSVSHTKWRQTKNYRSNLNSSICWFWRFDSPDHLLSGISYLHCTPLFEQKSSVFDNPLPPRSIKTTRFFRALFLYILHTSAAIMQDKVTVTTTAKLLLFPPSLLHKDSAQTTNCWSAKEKQPLG